ncbi:MAG: hypothetical protein U1E03_12420 [Hyphomonadaceae bacterium]
MIINVPTSEGLNDVSLRLHYSAWSSLIGMLMEFASLHEQQGYDVPGSSWQDEWKDYLAVSQPHLQATCTVIQQSNELALKSRIAEVSPFLLLLGNDPNFSAAVKDVDFSELRTLDAVSLPGAVNSLSAKPVSDSFVSSYNKVRSLRNKISHLGTADDNLDPHELLHLLIAQYAELWPNRRWLRDRMTFAAQSPQAHLYDYKYYSPALEVFNELPFFLALTSKSEFEALIGRKKSTRRYLCFSCFHERSVREEGADPASCRMAFLNTSGTNVTCEMCAGDFPVVRVPCNDDGCPGNVLARDEDGELFCGTCGGSQEPA